MQQVLSEETVFSGGFQLLFFVNISNAARHVKCIFPPVGRSALCTGFNGSAAFPVQDRKCRHLPLKLITLS
jgi:hypothetical protein